MTRCSASKSRRSAAISVASRADVQIGGIPNVQSPFIPPRTRAELQTPSPPGYRHEQIKKLVLPLLGAGLTEEAVFWQLRAMYDPDVSNREIRDLITWAASKNPKPCSYARPRQTYDAPQPARPIRVTSEEATAKAKEWLDEFRCALYGKEEYIIITRFVLEESAGEQKASPTGAGTTLLRDEWMRSFRDHGVPQNEAGAWIQPNPGLVSLAKETNHRPMDTSSPTGTASRNQTNPASISRCSTLSYSNSISLQKGVCGTLQTLGLHVWHNYHSIPNSAKPLCRKD
jgi:hypothetical protein